MKSPAPLHERDQTLDFMRLIGLTLIIFAHVKAPYVLIQLRSFDVPLMVMVSALSFSISFSGKSISYGAYVWSRIKRLVFPVWIFLSLYFLATTLLDNKD
ncbi:MAG: acyltransferase family protein [Micavibrio sp.]|nr:acyltransferase family protein [Micavibrio sp.]